MQSVRARAHATHNNQLKPVVQTLRLCRSTSCRVLALVLPDLALSVPSFMQSTYKISRRIEAEERALDAALMVITSTQQEVDLQWGLYDGYRETIAQALRLRAIRGHAMPEMHVIPPGLDFSTLKVRFLLHLCAFLALALLSVALLLKVNQHSRERSACARSGGMPW